ncbi:MAG: flippase-like domain-containing protein [bacterium]
MVCENNRTSAFGDAKEIGMISRRIFALFFFIYLATAGGHFYSVDNWDLYKITRNLIEYGHLHKNPDGTGTVKFGLLPSLASVPLYLIGRYFTDNIKIFLVSLTNQFVTALTCVLLFRWGLSLGYSPRTSVLLSVLYGLTTYAWAYSKFFYAEPLTALLICLALYSCSRCRVGRGVGWLVGAGASLGAALNCRPTAVLCLPFVGAYLWWAMGDSPWWSVSVRRVRGALWGILGFLPGVALFLWYNYYRWGNVFASAYIGENGGHPFSTPLWRGLFFLLLSPGRSLFLYSPILLAVPLGIQRFARDRLQELLTICGISVVWLAFHAKWWAVIGDWDWGPRLLLPIVPLWVMTLGGLLESGGLIVGPRRGAFLALVAISFLIQIPGFMFDFNSYIDRLRDLGRARGENLVYLSRFVPSLSPIWGNVKLFLAGRIKPDMIIKYMWGFPASLGIFPAIAVMLLPSFLAARGIVGILRGNRRESEGGDEVPVSLGKRVFNIRTLISFALALGVIYILLTRVNLKEILRVMGNVSWPLFVMGFLVHYLAFPVRGLRWRRVLRNLSLEGNLADLTEMVFLSWFANAVVPAKLGDIYRGYLLKRTYGFPMSKGLGTVLVERVLDISIVIVLMGGAGAIAFSGRLPRNVLALLYAGLAVIACLILGLLFMRTFREIIRKAIPRRMRPLYANFEEGVLGSLQSRGLPLLVSLTAAVWVLESGRAYLIMRSLSLPIGFFDAIFVSLAAATLTTLPITPAGLGAVEAAIVGILLLFGFRGEVGASVAVLDRLISYWSILIFGLIAYLLSRKTKG